MCRTTFMPSGIRLQQLIQNQHKEILAREKNNDKFFICMTLVRIGRPLSVPPVG